VSAAPRGGERNTGHTNVGMPTASPVRRSAYRYWYVNRVAGEAVRLPISVWAALHGEEDLRPLSGTRKGRRKGEQLKNRT
jgi:hypothetical protein